jgi:hypothetical protein
MSETAILQQEPAMTSKVKLSETETICMLDKANRNHLHALQTPTYLPSTHCTPAPIGGCTKPGPPVYYVGREVEGGENGCSHNQK